MTNCEPLLQVMVANIRCGEILNDQLWALAAGDDSKHQVWEIVNDQLWALAAGDGSQHQVWGDPE